MGAATPSCLPPVNAKNAHAFPLATLPQRSVVGSVLMEEDLLENNHFSSLPHTMVIDHHYYLRQPLGGNKARETLW